MTNRHSAFMTGARRFVCLTIALAALTAGCQTKPAAPPVSANAWAVVNGHEITKDDVDKAFRRTDQGVQPMAEDQAFAARLVLLDELIAEELFLAKARELKIELPESELDTAFAEARKNVPEDTFKQELDRRTLTAADMREALRRDMLVQKLFEREVSAKVTVTDQDITAFFEANRSDFNRTEDAYRIAQIVITPVREDQITNRTGSDAASAEEAKAKLQMVLSRLKEGTAFDAVAADFSEDPQTSARGGDLGFLPVSAVKQYPPQLRDAVLTGAPGSAKVLGANGGYVIVVVLGKDSAGQKDLGTPGVKDAISQSLRNRREQLLRSAYISNLRNSAAIENVIAKRVVESQGKVPTLGPVAPGTR